jgi:hypothetical protein
LEWPDPLGRKIGFSKMMPCGSTSAILICWKKLDIKNTLQIQKRFLKLGWNCAFESKNTKTKVFDAILDSEAILSNLIIFEEIVLGATGALDYQQICVKMLFLLGSVSVEFLQENISTDAMLVFWPPF